MMNMSLFVIAMEIKHNSYHTFRILDDLTGEVRDVLALELLQAMTRRQSPVKINHLKATFDSFKFIGLDESRLCLLDENMQPKINKDSLVITKIIDDTASASNYLGQIISVHQLQIVSNVNKKRYTLVNADILPSGRISVRPSE